MRCEFFFFSVASSGWKASNKKEERFHVPANCNSSFRLCCWQTLLSSPHFFSLSMETITAAFEPLLRGCGRRKASFFTFSFLMKPLTNSFIIAQSSRVTTDERPELAGGKFGESFSIFFNQWFPSDGWLIWGLMCSVWKCRKVVMPNTEMNEMLKAWNGKFNKMYGPKVKLVKNMPKANQKMS